MSNTPDVPPSREQTGEPEVESPVSSPDTPTVDFRKRPGNQAPLRIDTPPTQDRHPIGLTNLAVPSPLVAEVPPELVHHPRYRVMEVLGKGGMGVVYKAEHRVMKRAVALKAIGIHLVANPTAVERFRREVEAAAKLSHPNIVTAYDAEQAGNCHFLVMELVDGISLDRVLKRKGLLPRAFACDYVRQAALGLQHAHEHGMVHRDIKPQNLMLTRKGQVKILDFGLARFASENSPTASLTECGVLAGTPDFMAPEQAEDAHGADIRADIYSLGCTFYTLLTGQLPFPGGSYVEKVVSHLKKKPPPLTAFRDDLPPELIQIVGRMMAKDPAQRFQTPDEVAKALLAFRKTGMMTGGPDSAADKDEEVVLLIPPEPRSESIQTSEETPVSRAARSRPVRRRNRPPSRRIRGLVVAGLAIGAIGLLGLGGLLFVALSRGGGGDKKVGASLPAQRDEGQGQVSVVSMDPNLQLAIRRGPKVFGTIASHAEPMTLPAGEYEVEVVGGAPELRGFKDQLSLAQGDRKVVEVRLEGVFIGDFTTIFPPPPGRPGGPPPPRPGGPPRQ